jgi:hypothetical protein
VLAENSETLSEGKGTSDRVGKKQRNTVKRQGNFGQSWQKTARHCQKARELRTELAENIETLSKDKGTSDRVGRKHRDTVRRQGNFGQSWQKTEKHCQKARELRTELAENIETLSEGKGTSDRVGKKQRDTVKRQGNFGQSWQKTARHSQKARELRTELAENIETLSKGKGTSDRVGRKHRDTVRRQGNFGQLQ